eukprot:3665761-Pyramimonas_sp.AAC.1
MSMSLQRDASKHLCLCLCIFPVKARRTRVKGCEQTSTPVARPAQGGAAPIREIQADSNS